MKTVDDLVNNLVNIIPCDNNEYTLFVQFDKENEELYLELSDEIGEILADGSYNTGLLVSPSECFNFKYDWEVKFKFVKNDKCLEIISTAEVR